MSVTGNTSGLTPIGRAPSGGSLLRLGKTGVGPLVATLAMFGFYALHPTNQITYLAISVAVFALAATGLALLYGDCGLLSVAHGGIVGVGAYATIMALANGLSLAVALVTAIGIGVVTAVTIGGPSLRLQGHYFAVTTFAAAETMALIAGNLGWIGGTGGKSLPFGSGFLRTQSGLFYASFGTLIAVVTAVVLLRRTRFGERLAAIRENEVLARSLGVRTRRLKLYVFALSGGICGLAGFFLAFANQFVSPLDLGSQPGIALVLILILGGSTHWLGPFVGATLYYGLPYIFPLTPLQNQLAIGALLIIMILVLPGGIVGAALDVRYKLTAAVATRAGRAT